MQKTTFTVGRDPGADIPIADNSVSRLHAEVTFAEGGRLFVTGCRSSNGTFLQRGPSEVRITQQTVEPTDTVRFGAVNIAASDLYAILMEKTGGAAGQPRPKPKPGPLPRSAKLVRCSCGAVKTLGTTCEICGE